MRLVDADAILEILERDIEYNKDIPERADGIRDAIITILGLPSVQPQIIRCKDCRHNGSFDTDCPIDWNGKDYCSFAER